MQWPIWYLYGGLVAASVAAATYSVWTVRWAQRRAPLLAVLNGLVALTGLVLIAAHLVSLTEPTTLLRIRFAPWKLLIGDISILLPAIARLLELRRDKARDAVRDVIETTITAQRTGEPRESSGE